MWGVSFILLSVIALSAGQTVADHEQVVACYVSTWAVYRPAKGQFNLENVNPTLCTHIIYAFTGIEELTFKMKSLDPEFDINRGGFEKAISLKKRNPKLKVTIAVGGWIEGSEKYSAMASTKANRKAFIDSVVQFIQTHNFDGLDLDWEYPANRGGKPIDKENFVLLCKELKEAFANRGWLLTAAVGASKAVADSAYDLPKLSMYLDFIHLMAYDYHGKWDLRTGHNAPLYPRVDEEHGQSTLNVNFSVNYYLSHGVPANKFVLGLGMYGRTFLLNNTANPGIGAPAMKSAFSGPYTREDGFLGYNEICEKQTSERGWSIAWQSAHQAPYMFKDKMWISFDDTNSLGLKVAYAQRLGLAGVMIWSIDTDDFRGECSQQRFPLLRSINRNMILHAQHRQEDVTTIKPPTTQKDSGAPLPPIGVDAEKVPLSPVRPIAEEPTPLRPLPDHPTDILPLPDHPSPSRPPTVQPIPAQPVPSQPTPHIPIGVPLPDHQPPVQPIPAHPDVPTGRPLPDLPPHPHPHDHDHDHDHGIPLHPPHDPSVYDELDKDKPGSTDIFPDHTNELESTRYYPAAEHEGSSAARSSQFFSSLAVVLTILSYIYL